ncbi:MAG TPA: hypothetical protein VFD87_17520 [Phototrophicaceae bacterium]|nr:hypothetical protein [Phototrophicaceae bacterium]
MGILLLYEIRKAGQGIPPHGLDVDAQGGEAFGIQAEIVARAAAFLFDQLRGAEDLQVLRDGGAADGEAIGKVADGGGSFAQEVENGLTRWIGEG